MPTPALPEKWFWTELIGFDNASPDFGVGEFFDRAGFAPDALCLLVNTPDFVLQHGGMDREIVLPPDICARAGHDKNEDRSRQDWTNWQVRGLVEALKRRGVSPYLSFFAGYRGDQFHREWASDHLEVLQAHLNRKLLGGINSLKRLKDGTWYEDFFCAQLAAAVEDYGFDGWHGADGNGPLSGPIYNLDFSDDMAAQFIEARGGECPPWLLEPVDGDWDALARRADWIWRHRRHDWIGFWADRWAAFWAKAAQTLHALGKKAVVNSAWGRAPFESLYRYGVDYRKLVAAGVDGIVVETAAAGLAADPRRVGDRHTDFLSMLMLLRACVPETKLIFLHNARDICEQWDTLRHFPALLEKEIFSLANVFHQQAGGPLRRSADGFLVCLADGIQAHEWQWLNRRWETAFGPAPQRVLGATLVWSGVAMDKQVEDFTATRRWTVHRTLDRLMDAGAPVQATVDASSLGAAQGALLAINPHLFAPEEREALVAYSNGPVIALAPESADLPAPAFRFSDIFGPDALTCFVYGMAPEPPPDIPPEEPPPPLPDDLMARFDPCGYWEFMPSRGVSRGFLKAVAGLLARASGAPVAAQGAEDVMVMAAEQPGGTHRVGVKNRKHVYALAEIDMGKEIREIRVLSEFPLIRIEPRGARFTVKVPPKGVVVLDVVCAGGCE